MFNDRHAKSNGGLTRNGHPHLAVWNYFFRLLIQQQTPTQCSVKNLLNQIGHDTASRTDGRTPPRLRAFFFRISFRKCIKVPPLLTEILKIFRIMFNLYQQIQLRYKTLNTLHSSFWIKTTRSTRLQLLLCRSVTHRQETWQVGDRYVKMQFKLLVAS